MHDGRIEDVPPKDRRGFFALGLARLLAPLADYVEKRLPADVSVSRTLLRPPGALPEPEFLDTCFRCGRCAEACPANAISLSISSDPKIKGTPFVDPDRQACVICDELACMKVCPSGALRLVDRLEIRMGLAHVNHDVCVRSKGESCTICIDKCPLGATAIQLDSNGAVCVIDPTAKGPGASGCTGCGVCQQYCPTRPVRAIRVFPND
jgi:MauM/NapG family ferredoxin protein